MTRRHARAPALIAVAVCGVWLATCTEPNAAGSVQSISPLQLPSPGIVVADTMRDSTGAVAPLRVVGFAPNGDTVAGTTATFVTLDTFAHLVGGNVLVADRLGGARVLGAIGTIQTLPETVKVTLSPDTIVAADSTHHFKTYSFIGDSLATSAELGVRVEHRAGGSTSDVDAVIVRYSIVSAPAAKGSVPTVTLMNGNQVSSRDTSLGGRAGRTLRLRVQQLTSLTDSAVIAATASYRGRSLGTVQFTVVFKNQ